MKARVRNGLDDSKRSRRALGHFTAERSGLETICGLSPAELQNHLTAGQKPQNNGTMAIEGMPLTDEDKERLRLVLSGDVTADEMVQQLAEKYRAKGEKMNNYSLELHFDADSSERIGSLIRTVADTCGNDYMLRRNIPFHLTLAYFEVEDTSAAVNISEKIAAESSANAVIFPAIGAFPPATLYLAPVFTKWIWELNENANYALDEKVTLSPMYQPNNWVPHATIATQLSKMELNSAFAALSLEFTPFVANAESIAIVKCDPYDEKIAEFMLTGEVTQ
jgi:2'-5' RNA ligase